MKRIVWLSSPYGDDSGRRDLYGSIESLPDGTLAYQGREGSLDVGEIQFMTDGFRRNLQYRLGREPSNDELFSFILGPECNRGQFRAEE